MISNSLIRAREQAENAVKDMKDDALKVAAFQTILRKLLDEADSPASKALKISHKTPTSEAAPDSLPGRILLLKEDDYFEEQRMLGEVREALGTRGWHYPVTTLSGAMQSLVRRRLLRRQQASSGNKKVWKYSNP